MKNALLIFLVLCFLSGCTVMGWKKGKTEKKQEANRHQLDEKLRQNIAGAVDSIDKAPTNPPVMLAKKFLQGAQQITGLPDVRIDIIPILAGQAAAITALEKHFDRSEELIKERTQLQLKVDELTAQLVNLGQQYEAERNTKIGTRIKRWTIATLGIGGIVALFVFCPFLLAPAGAIGGRLLGWVIGLIPQLGTFFGVVSKKAFDASTVAIQEIRNSAKEKDLSKTEIDTVLDRHTKPNALLIKHRKHALGV
jgi:hypothetical protein